MACIHETTLATGNSILHVTDTHPHIHGERARWTGILNDEIYIGSMVWNKEPGNGCRACSLFPMHFGKR
jgi:hypothetical protein